VQGERLAGNPHHNPAPGSVMGGEKQGISM